MNPILFWSIAVFVVIAALMVVRLPNIFHAGLSLIATFGGVAAVYAMLDAHFLAAVQVLIYVGAISVILMFAVMLTQHLAQREVRGSMSRHVSGALVAGLFGLFAVIIVNTQQWPSGGLPFKYLQAGDIGKLFLDKNAFLVPFEMVAILLLVALVGAVMVARKEGDR
ncbi:MAG: NADH-quinone oxidoreductase subunit J [Armatimonadetes bacterium]|nr:NADH-quinone oxidoreductase subunit J [Armatimonadota bacterium]